MYLNVCGGVWMVCGGMWRCMDGGGPRHCQLVEPSRPLHDSPGLLNLNFEHL